MFYRKHYLLYTFKEMSHFIKQSRGFTIVELLIVIVVIAILAAVTIVSYNGISSRAKDSQIKSDLETAAKQLLNYQTINGTFPLNSAGDAGVVDRNGITYTYTYNPGDNTYCLVAKNGTISYSITAKNPTPGSYACVSTLAGSPTGQSGYVDGTGITARFWQPGYITLGQDNMLYVTDGNGYPRMVRKINPATAEVTTVFSQSGFIMQGITVSASGTIYGTTGGSGNCVKKVLTATTSSDLACSSLSYPAGITLAGDGNLYVVDSGDYVIKRVNPTTGAITNMAGLANTGGFADGSGTTARFYDPWMITTGADGSLYITDCSNNRIRKMTTSGVVSTVAGSGASGSADGAALSATLNCPWGIAADATGALYFSDGGGDGAVRMLKNGQVTTLANGTTFGGGSGLATNPSQTGVVYIASYNQNRIFKLQ